jgi:TRAP-type C4-dicarboxylate transport system permease small subunit
MTHLDFVYAAYIFGFGLIALVLIKEILRAKRLKKQIEEMK